MAATGTIPFNASRIEETATDPNIRAIVAGEGMPSLKIEQISNVGGLVPLHGQSLTFNGGTGLYEPTTVAPPGGGLLQPDDSHTVGPAEEASQQVLLAFVPTAGTLMISINGLDQRAGIDYSLLANLVTFIVPLTIVQGDGVLAKYQ